MLLVLAMMLASCGGGSKAEEEKPVKNAKEAVYIGDVPIGEYRIVTSGAGASNAAKVLQSYIEKTCGATVSISSGKADGYDHFIRILTDKELETAHTAISGGNVTIEAPDKAGIADETLVFINSYLGWMYAGTEKETVSDEKSVLHIPTDVDDEGAWIKEREAIVTLWNTSIVRGNSYNENTSTKTDILTYSDEEIYEYVKMLKWCGFTGVQVTDMCASWVATSGVDFVQQRLRTMADAAHSMGMKFTLWVWAANFDEFGWVDETVTYDKGGYEFQYQNPDVVATFEKYYDIYASLADVTDRMICHFYDPGKLDTADDVGFFSKMLMDKVHAVNPDIDFGISCWIDAFDVGVILSYTGTDVTIYEGNLQSDGGIDGSVRNKAYTFATRLGTWSWNTCGMEVDQLAMMQYNPHIIKATYDQMRQYDDIMVPSYWSEMDSYHILNVFSLYCAGQLLKNPDRDLAELTREVSLASVGPEYAESFADALLLLEKARSGEGWDTYWWKSEDYVLLSDDYPAEEILAECKRIIPELEKMVSEGVEGYCMPTPVSMTDVIKMMIPHLRQIEEFATFRSEFDKLKAEALKGENLASLSKRLYDIATPVHEYNTVMGVWGQPESRAQRILVLDLCDETGLEVPIYPAYDAVRKERIYNALCMQQKGKTEPVSTWTYSAKIAYHTEEQRLIDELIAEGRFTADEGIWFHLTDWQDYIYDFND